MQPMTPLEVYGFADPSPHGIGGWGYRITPEVRCEAERADGSGRCMLRWRIDNVSLSDDEKEPIKLCRRHFARYAHGKEVRLFQNDGPAIQAGNHKHHHEGDAHPAGDAGDARGLSISDESGGDVERRLPSGNDGRQSDDRGHISSESLSSESASIEVALAAHHRIIRAEMGDLITEPRACPVCGVTIATNG